jgi:signal transduction histidine kinase
MEPVVGGDPQFEAHPTRLRRPFENLFWNALNHGNAETVRVGTSEDGIYVEDDGGGIPVEDRKRVFESGYSTTDEGSGYGLHIVTGIVDMHDWAISVTEGTDGGARFEIR